jgi:hypothetical protein
MQRRSNWTPVIVSERADRTDGEAVSEVVDDVPAPTLSALNVTYLDDAAGSSRDMSKFLDRKILRQADLRFAIGVTFALALPVFLGLGVFIAATAFLKAS